MLPKCYSLHQEVFEGGGWWEDSSSGHCKVGVEYKLELDGWVPRRYALACLARFFTLACVGRGNPV